MRFKFKERYVVIMFVKHCYGSNQSIYSTANYFKKIGALQDLLVILFSK
jgi:hypothetical protein